MNLEKSKIKYLLVLALLAITLPMAAWLASRPQLIQKQAACGVSVKLTPASGSYAKSAAFPVSLQIEAGTTAVATANVNLSFDASKLKINSIVLASPLNTQIIKNINNTNGTAQIMAFDAGGTGATGTVNFATIQFEGLVTTSTPVAVTIGSTEITAMGEGAACTATKTNGAYTITATVAPTNTPVPGATNTPGPTNTPVPTATPTGTIAPTPTPTGIGKLVNLKVKMIGVDGLPAATANRTKSFRVKFTLASNQSLVGPIYQANGTVDANGIWTIGVPLQVDIAGGTYNIYVKGPMHLQKKFPNISFASFTSEITKDLAALGERYYLEPGDLAVTGPNKDRQDGVVNAFDADYLNNEQTGCITKPDDATCLAKADLNLDGLITGGMDIALMNRTVYSRWEDEVE